jgi:predicted unusual protein kinase regulating ubiquinone biosynthesis (AarF/ABC1/UbiB family)
VLEELDYRREATNQQRLHEYFAGHPTISIPRIIPELSTRRVVTSELVTGARFAEVLSWPQDERDLAGETLYRFVFRSLYEMREFNGDPHPGNYVFHGGGRVTFLDFGMVKHFTEADVLPLMHMARTLCVDDDAGRFRASLEEAGFLVPGAPLTDAEVVDHLAVFYQLIRERAEVTVTGEYASAVVRRFFDVRSPVAQWARIPRSYVVLQRINLGLFALLGEMNATANWRAIAEEIWPFMRASPTTAIGRAELSWLARRPPVAAPVDRGPRG